MRVAIKAVPDSTPRPETRAALPPLVDNPFVPDILATGLAGFANVGGMIMVTLESARCDHSHEPATFERVVTGRLALTPAAAQTLVAALNEFLEQQGLSPSQAIRGGATRQ